MWQTIAIMFIVMSMIPAGDLAGKLLTGSGAAGSLYGAYLTASRWVADAGIPIALIFSQLAIAAVALTQVGLTTLPAWSASTAWLTLASAAFSMLGNLLLVYAYTRAPASILAPLVYFQLIAATGLGWLVFQDIPDAFTWAGLALILNSGLAAALRH